MMIHFMSGAGVGCQELPIADTMIRGIGKRDDTAAN